MLYMAAAQDERTERAAMDDIKELERVEIDESKLNVLIQIDRQWPGYAERFRIEKVTGEKKGKVEDEKKGRSVPWKALKDRVRNIPDDNGRYISDAKLGAATDSGQSKVLRDFVAAAREKYPDDYFLLVLWGHAYGLGFGRDHGDPLTLKELARSLDRKELNKQLAELGARQIAEDRKAVDILGANACAMSYLEAAYELRHAAAFMVAPEIAMPFAGWPYDKILNEIIQTPGIEPQVLGEKIVAEFVKSFRRQDVALTLLNLDKVEGLKDPLKNLAGALTSSIKDKTKGEQIVDAFLDTAHGDVRPLIDLYDLCEKAISIEELEDAAKKLREFPRASENTQHRSGCHCRCSPGRNLKFGVNAPADCVVIHDSAPNIEGLHGIGIYAPSLTGETTLTRLELDDKMYKALELMAYASEWPTLVYTELNTLLKPMNEVVRQLVKNTGATLREDRTGVAQLLLSVDRSFIKLEAAVNKTRGCVMSSLGNGKSTSSTLPTGTLSTDTVSTNQQERTLAAARRLSRPYLRLATDFAEIRYGGTPAASDVFDSLSGARWKVLQRRLKVSRMWPQSVERTIKKVLTNSTLGLGDGVKVRMGKPDMGKPDMGKPDMGKPDMGPFARFRTSASDSLEQPDGLSATELFRQAAAALRLLEEAIAELESDVRLFLTNPRLGTNGDGADYERRSTEQLKLSFQTLNEVVANARDIVFGILLDPSQGLGPAPEQRLITFNRHNLALAGGLSALDLSLL
jgi:hypothetical protein